MMNHADWMGTGHWGLMLLWWLLILGGVFALGFFTGRTSGRRGKQDCHKAE